MIQLPSSIDRILDYLKNRYILCAASNGPYEQQLNRLKNGKMLSYFVLCLYRNYKLRKYIVLPRDKYLPLNILVIVILIILYYQTTILWHLLGIIIGTSYTIYINKSFLREIFNRKNYNFLNRFKRKSE